MSNYARSWLTILTQIADMQPGDIDKLPQEEADLVRKIVNNLDEDTTLCLDTEDYHLVNKALDRLGKLQ